MKNKILSLLAVAALASSAFAQTIGPVVSTPFVVVSNTLTPKSTSTPQAYYIGGNLAGSTLVFDATGYNQVRLVFQASGTGIYNPLAGVELLVRYQAIPPGAASLKDNNLADYVKLGAGASDVFATFTSTTSELEIGAWTDIDPGANGNDAFLLEIVDPSNAGKQSEASNVQLQFRTVTP